MLKLNLGERERLETGNQGEVNDKNFFLRKWRVGEIPLSLDLSFESHHPQLLLKLFQYLLLSAELSVKGGSLETD